MVTCKVASSLTNGDFNKLMGCKMPKWMRLALRSAAKEFEY